MTPGRNCSIRTSAWRISGIRRSRSLGSLRSTAIERLPRLSEAQYALERAASLFAHDEVASRFGDVVQPDGRSATLILRDLAVRFDEPLPRRNVASEGTRAP